MPLQPPGRIVGDKNKYGEHAYALKALMGLYGRKTAHYFTRIEVEPSRPL